MTPEQIKAETKFRLSMAIVRQMHRRGLLTDEQLTAAERELSRIYMPTVGGILYQSRCNN